MTDEDQAPPPLEASGSADAGIAPEVSRRVGSILDAVEREAARLHDEAREDAWRYLEHAKRHADGLVAERRLRISELSDELLSKAEAVVARLDDAAPVRQGFENLVRALGDAAERLSRETEVAAGDFEPPAFYPEHASEPPAPVPQPEPPHPPVPYDPAPDGYVPTPSGPYPPSHPAPEAPPWQPPPQPPRGAFSEESFDPYRGFPPQHHPSRTPPASTWQPQPPPAPPPPDQGGAPGSGGWREFDDARMIAIQMAATGSTRSGVREHLKLAFGIADAAGILDEIFGADTGENARVPWTARPR